MPEASSFRARTVEPRLDLPKIPEVVSPGLRDQFQTDVLLVNPPSPNKDPYIRDIHRVGRNSREGTIWPQTSLAQLAAMFPETMSVRVVDCIAERMTWRRFEQLLLDDRPRYYITQATAPTLTNDMRGAFLARTLGATTLAIGTHVSPATEDTLQAYPALDFVIRGEPEETARELVDTLEAIGRRADDESRVTAPWSLEPETLAGVLGIAYRRDGQVVVNPDRPFIKDLDALPIPRHELLPLDRYKLPIVGGRYTFVVTSRGCPAGCRFCIKHVTYGNSFRLRSPAHIMEEVWKLVDLGTSNIHFEADLFTINRDQVVGLCQAILDASSKGQPPIRWTCNSRVDFVDEELLRLMGRAGCWMISWGIESGSPEILKRARKGTGPEQAEQALRWSKAAGIRNWGYFVLGLPGETEETIEQTIAFSKTLPLDLALFHIAVPYPGTPFWFEALQEDWLRVERWEDFDMYNSTVVEYPNLTAAQLQKAARRAARAWSLRPGPMWTFVKEMRHPATLGQLLRIGLRYLNWIVAGD
jgi:anaerobic magnesium-protoporphyrin IX monomethyl ester cyclase